jgi:hypothetical protein
MYLHVWTSERSRFSKTRYSSPGSIKPAFHAMPCHLACLAMKRPKRRGCVLAYIIHTRMHQHGKGKGTTESQYMCVRVGDIPGRLQTAVPTPEGVLWTRRRAEPSQKGCQYLFRYATARWITLLLIAGALPLAATEQIPPPPAQAYRCAVRKRGHAFHHEPDRQSL